jgi:hypothetical protein
MKIIIKIPDGLIHPEFTRFNYLKSEAEVSFTNLFYLNEIPAPAETTL